MLALLLEKHPRVTDAQPEPERPPGEALVRLRLAGVCDTDIQLARGYMGYQGVLGHEFVGDVLEADDPAWVGQRVVADINAGCGICADCTLGDGHHCNERTVLGISGRHGAFAERFVVPERSLVRVPDSVPDETAVFAEPLAAALHVLDEVKLPPGAPAVVLGDGKLGLLTALALKGAGLPVTLVGHHEDKLDLARARGVEGLLESALDPDFRAALVIEATGSARGVERALSLTLPKGTIVLKTTVAARTTVDLSPVVIHELRVIGSRCGPMHRAVEALGSGAVDPRPLIAARYGLREADRALARAEQRGTLKVLIEGTNVSADA